MILWYQAIYESEFKKKDKQIGKEPGKIEIFRYFDMTKQITKHKSNSKLWEKDVLKDSEWKEGWWLMFTFIIILYFIQLRIQQNSF